MLPNDCVQESFNGLYGELRNHFHMGIDTRTETVRGNRVTELTRPCSWIVESNPWLTCHNRKLNPFFAAAEIFWILSGKGSVEWISRFNSNMRSFSDGGPDFNAPYGKRIFAYDCGFERGDGVEGMNIAKYDQVERAVSKLKTDPSTRQAVISIFHPHYDYLKSKDIACNSIIYLSLRDGKLNTTVTQRSNDFVWGTPYNMLQFWHLGLLIAGELGVERGWHCHLVNNLHIYEGMYPTLLEWLDEKMKFEELNQRGCFQTITRAKLRLLVRYLEPGYGFSGFDFSRVMCDETIPEYWRILWLLPALYVAYDLHRELDKEKRKESKNWIMEHLNSLSSSNVASVSLFKWLVKDFWNLEQ